MSVINTATNTVVATTAVGDSPGAVAVRPDGERAYVANYGSDTVSIINTADNTVGATKGVGNGPAAIAVADTPNGTRAYVADQLDGTVSVIQTNAINAVIARSRWATSPAAWPSPPTAPRPT